MLGAWDGSWSPRSKEVVVVDLDVDGALDVAGPCKLVHSGTNAQAVAPQQFPTHLFQRE